MVIGLAGLALGFLLGFFWSRIMKRFKKDPADDNVNPDPEAVFGQAEVFYVSATVYHTHVIGIQAPGAKLPHQVPSPYFVNLGFSVELFLKTLLFLEGKNVRTHKLPRLYNQLSNETRQSIQEKYGENYKTIPLFIRDQFKKSYPDKDFSKVKVALEFAGSPFEIWRYSFEVDKQGHGVIGLEPITKSIVEVVLKKKAGYKLKFMKL